MSKQDRIDALDVLKATRTVDKVIWPDSSDGPTFVYGRLSAQADRFSVVRTLVGMQNRHESFQCYTGRPGGHPGPLFGVSVEMNRPVRTVRVPDDEVEVEAGVAAGLRPADADAVETRRQRRGIHPHDGVGEEHRARADAVLERPVVVNRAVDAVRLRGSRRCTEDE